MRVVSTMLFMSYCELTTTLGKCTVWCSPTTACYIVLLRSGTGRAAGRWRYWSVIKWLHYLKWKAIWLHAERARRREGRKEREGREWYEYICVIQFCVRPQIKQPPNQQIKQPVAVLILNHLQVYMQAVKWNHRRMIWEDAGSCVG